MKYFGYKRTNKDKGITNALITQMIRPVKQILLDDKLSQILLR